MITSDRQPTTMLARTPLTSLSWNGDQRFAGWKFDAPTQLGHGTLSLHCGLAAEQSHCCRPCWSGLSSRDASSCRNVTQGWFAELSDVAPVHMSGSLHVVGGGAENRESTTRQRFEGCAAFLMASDTVISRGAHRCSHSRHGLEVSHCMHWWLEAGVCRSLCAYEFVHSNTDQHRHQRVEACTHMMNLSS